jgi:hypothetical protein
MREHGLAINIGNALRLRVRRVVITKDAACNPNGVS